MKISSWFGKRLLVMDVDDKGNLVRRYWVTRDGVTRDIDPKYLTGRGK